MMLFANPRSVLVICLRLVGYLLLASKAADAQTYLYNYSYFSTGDDPLGAVLVDFNDDGRSDLATVNAATINSDGTVSVMLGGTNATFGSPVSYATGKSPFAMIATDTRGNGRMDLVTVNTPNGIDLPGVVSVLLGHGDGTFQVHVDYFVGDFPTGVAAGDFNADGKLDLAISNEFDNAISILYGNGDGTFQPQVLIDVGSEPTSLAAGDFDGDGRTDLIASCVGSGVVSVLLNAGAGTFTRVDTVSGLLAPDKSLVVTGNFSADGKLDAIISSRILGQLYLLRGEGDGHFMFPQPMLATPNGLIDSLVVTDINHDGKHDLAYGSPGPTGLSILFGNGRGRFSAPVLSPLSATGSFAFADINGDGFLDFVSPAGAFNSVAVVLGNGRGQFGLPKTVSLSETGQSPDSTVLADFNGDGKLDLAVAETNFQSGQLAVFLGNGRGSFGTPIISPLLSKAINNQGRMFSGDFNGDGKLEVIVMDDFSTGFQVLLGNGDGSFQTPVDTKLNVTLNFSVGDFNGDGKTDLVVSTFFNGQELISIYLSQGDGTFALGPQYTEQYGGPNVADVNHDGKSDLVFVGNPVFVMLGNGDGTFQKPITGTILTTQSSAAIEDFNGDGALDIVAATGSGVAFLKGNGDGTFQSPVYSDSETLLCCQFQTEDVNGDGKLDLINNTSFSVLVLLGNGDGTFQSPFSYTTNGLGIGISTLAADFNSDGIGDIGIVFEDVTSGTMDASLFLSLPVVALFPNAIDFGSIPVGQVSSSVSVQLSNVGNKKLSISSIQTTGDFVERNNCGQQLGMDKTCTIQVVFKPHKTGAQSGAINIIDNALGASQQISLTGIGK